MIESLPSEEEKEKQSLNEKLKIVNDRVRSENFEIVARDIEVTPALKNNLDVLGKKMLDKDVRKGIIAVAISLTAITNTTASQSKIEIGPVEKELGKEEFVSNVKNEYKKNNIISNEEIFSVDDFNPFLEVGELTTNPFVLNISSESLRVVDSQNLMDESVIDREILPNLVVISEVSSEIKVLNENIKINKICLDDLEDLFVDARLENISLYIRSAFRSIEEQKIAYSHSTDKNASAIPGASQHHTGLAIDFTTPEIGNIVNVNADFSSTEAGKWLSENAWEYGFVLSYTHNHDGLKNEDWHYFYVGKELGKIWYEHQLKEDDIDLFSLQKEYNYQK